MNAPVAREPRARAFDSDLSGRLLDMSLLRRLLEWLAPERPRLLVSGVLVLVNSTLQVMLPVVLSLVVIDHVLMQGARSDIPDFGLVAFTDALAAALALPPLVAACALYATLHVLMAISGHFHRVTLADAVIRALTDLRQSVFDHLLRQPAAFWDRVAVGRVTTRVTNDVEALYELLRSLGTLIGEFVPFFVALAIMLAADPGLTGLLLCFAPVLAVLTFGFRRLTKRLYRAARQSLSRLNQNMQENLAGLTVVQLHGREAHNLDQYHAINSENRRQETRAMTFETSYAALNDSLGSLALAVVIWAGGQAVAMDTLTLGAVVLFTRYIDMLFQPIVALGDQYNLLFRAMASGERIFQALDWNEPMHEPVAPRPLPQRLAGEVRISHLDFAYGDGPEVLHDVSVSIPAGTTLAIVGPTGSGKSTLVRLLPRLYEVPAGHVFVDGMDVTELDARALRRRIGFVLQDFHVFAGTILDNITLGDAEVDRSRAIAAARQVGADSFIEALPLAYDTPLAERGRNLSQGQRQLLAFARTLAADPSLLILDEATASIDPETEMLVQRALAKVTANRTAIVIAHRLRTIRDADQVLVLVDGRVEAVGTHDDLLDASPTYARLHAMQFGGAAPATDSPDEP
jgi:ATP-binding cassette subfamily B multidrug efflux pump